MEVLVIICSCNFPLQLAKTPKAIVLLINISAIKCPAL